MRHRRRESFEYYGLIGSEYPIYRIRKRATPRGCRIAIHYHMGDGWIPSESKSCRCAKERDFFLDLARDRLFNDGFMRLPYCPPYLRKVQRKDDDNEK